MYIIGVSEPDDEIDTGMDLGGDMVVEARRDNSKTVGILAVATKKQGLDTAYIKRIFWVADTRLQVVEGFKTRGVSGLMELRGFKLVILGRSSSHG